MIHDNDSEQSHVILLHKQQSSFVLHRWLCTILEAQSNLNLAHSLFKNNPLKSNLWWCGSTTVPTISLLF